MIAPRGFGRSGIGEGNSLEWWRRFQRMQDVVIARRDLAKRQGIKARKQPKKRGRPEWWPRVICATGLMEIADEVASLTAMQFVPLTEGRDIEAGLREAVRRAFG